MFSNNGKISNHQATRLLILDVFTGACLFLPMALPRLAGEGGFLALLLGLLLTLVDGALLSWGSRQMRKPFCSKPRRLAGKGSAMALRASVLCGLCFPYGFCFHRF